MLGKLHQKAPNIPIILPWPSNRKSIKYIKEVLMEKPDHLKAHQFLAETFFKIGNIDETKKHFYKVIETEIDPEYYFEQLQVKKECETEIINMGLKIGSKSDDT